MAEQQISEIEDSPKRKKDNFEKLKRPSDVEVRYSDLMSYSSST